MKSDSRFPILQNQCSKNGQALNVYSEDVNPIYYLNASLQMAELTFRIAISAAVM